MFANLIGKNTGKEKRFGRYVGPLLSDWGSQAANPSRPLRQLAARALCGRRSVLFARRGLLVICSGTGRHGGPQVWPADPRGFPRLVQGPGKSERSRQAFDGVPLSRRPHEVCCMTWGVGTG